MGVEDRSGVLSVKRGECSLNEGRERGVERGGEKVVQKVQEGKLRGVVRGSRKRVEKKWRG